MIIFHYIIFCIIVLHYIIFTSLYYVILSLYHDITLYFPCIIILHDISFISLYYIIISLYHYITIYISLYHVIFVSLYYMMLSFVSWYSWCHETPVPSKIEFLRINLHQRTSQIINSSFHRSICFNWVALPLFNNYMFNSRVLPWLWEICNWHKGGE